LIGTLSVVYSVAFGAYGVLPFEFKQSLEIWITAAQSFFAIAILVNFNISLREAVGLLVLFVSQVVIEFLILRVLSVPNPEALSHQSLMVFTAIYVILGIALLIQRRRAVGELIRMTGATAREAMGKSPEPKQAD
jgi:cation:H+ antiporter